MNEETERIALPSFEEEVSGKTRVQLHDLIEEYIRRANELFWESWEGQMDSLIFYNRANSIGFIEEYLHVKEIVADPNANDEDKRFAANFIWFVQVNKTLKGRLRTPPWERAKIATDQKESKARESTVDERVEHYNWYKENADKILQEVLEEIPHPEGTIKTVAEFHEKFSASVENIEF